MKRLHNGLKYGTLIRLLSYKCHLCILFCRRKCFFEIKVFVCGKEFVHLQAITKKSRYQREMLI